MGNFHTRWQGKHPIQIATTFQYYPNCTDSNETQNSHVLGNKIIPAAGPPPLTHPLNLPRDTWITVTFVARTLRINRTGTVVVYSWPERVFILENYFASKSSAAISKTFSNAYPGKEVPNKTTTHRLVTKFRNTPSVCVWQVLIEKTEAQQSV
jgi:hypothetical protein